MNIRDILEEKIKDWPLGACSLMIEIEDYSGVCGRCGHSIEDHEYLNTYVHEDEVCKYECKEKYG